MRSTGWLQDPGDLRDYDFRDRLAVVSPPAGASLSLLPFRAGRLEQDGVSACVGFAVARALHICFLANGHTAAPVPSPLYLYYNGRAAESAGADPESAPPLEDRGSYPRLVMQACRALGFCPNGDWPFSYSKRNTRPQMRCYRRAYDQRGFEFFRILSSGSARIEEVKAALAMRYPVIFGMPVDKAFTEHKGADPIDSINVAEIVGGHMMTVVAWDGSVMFDNWWGADFGFGDGFGRLSEEMFGSALVGDIYAVKAAPLYAKGAP